MRWTIAVVTLISFQSSVIHAVPLSTTQWRSDIAFARQELERRHPDLYHTASRDSFHAGIDELINRVPSLQHHAIIAELARVVATIGDGHTLVNLLWDRQLGFQRLPIALERTSDGLVILEASSAYTHLLGARVLRIGSMRSDDALSAVRPLFSSDNPWTSLQATELLRVPEILHATGVTSTLDSVVVEVESAGGDRETVTLPAVGRDARTDVEICCGQPAPHWLRDREQRYWLDVLPEQRAVYVQFNGADADEGDESLAAFARRMERTVRDRDAERLIIDLRWNDGGSRWRARFLLNAIIRVEGFFGAERATRFRKPGGRVFAIIGPRTFSAATQFALDLDLHTNSVFVGEPTGGKPNHYGELGRFRLPHSGLEIRHSQFFHQASHPRDTRDAIAPDVEVLPTAADVRDGRDPALVAIDGYRTP